MLKIAVCDDSPIFLESAVGYIKKWSDETETPTDIHTYSNGDDLIRSGTVAAPDIVFLDIIMPLLSGMDTAREFINTILEFALEWGIPLSDNAIDRTDDIGRYLYYCLMHKKCAICGKDGEIHHEDAIGMGNNRRKVDDSNYKKICLCREHHTIAHQMGVIRFRQMYKVYGIVVKEVHCDTD